MRTEPAHSALLAGGETEEYKEHTSMNISQQLLLALVQGPCLFMWSS